MYYICKKTGKKFIHLAIAENIATMKKQVVFCPVDSDISIFTLNENEFYEFYDVVFADSVAA